ncbi:putative ATPase [Georgfuchsia toluolica]|uniref:ATPase n=1 Tax=Georgfuchsia toluolica TaxID=424218 RepID=A0A916NA55_9PROT|nr:helicase HerA-like domain-containing protein [Georgfuchsia toluolica]CAG4884922.1 putative ATPase [Georgfuchsia toluolica]
MTHPLSLARNDGNDLALLPALANRHGLIAGATGTGKTVTLQRLAEQFSAIGVPVFMADVKGDLSGLGAAGVASDKLRARLAQLGIDDWQPAACPTVFWDIYGAQGHPVRATISDMGPLLLARLLNLNDTQSGVLQLVFKIADDQGLLLLDLKDLRAMVQHVGEHAVEFKTEYGNVSAASIGAIQRGLLEIEEQGGANFFGEPMLDIADLMQTDSKGHGVINILAGDKLMNAPRLYSSFLLWLLAELFEQLPEAGDLDKPKLVFFFDEAHLLFNEAPPALLEKIEQVVRLIRSKGVGIYFVTQNPLDVPDSVLGQLGNRVQHALRAFTPRDQKAVKTAAQTLRANPKLNVETAITELGVGEALVSFLDAKGTPGIVERAFVLPPSSRIGPLTADERVAAIKSSLLYGHYEKTADRESAYEKLKGQAAPAAAPAQSAPQASTGGILEGLGGLFGGGSSRGRQGVVEAAVKSAARTIGSQVGREIIRGVLGSILGGRRR